VEQRPITCRALQPNESVSEKNSEENRISTKVCAAKVSDFLIDVSLFCFFLRLTHFNFPFVVLIITFPLHSHAYTNDVRPMRGGSIRDVRPMPGGL
jgi:hypothetical protein